MPKKIYEIHKSSSFKPFNSKIESPINFPHTDELHDKKKVHDLYVRSIRYSNNDIFLIESDHERSRRREERHSFCLESDTAQNTVVDIREDGSPFVTEWFLYFTNGELKLSFDRLFNALIAGIKKEGELKSESHLQQIIDSFLLLRMNESDKSESKLMKKLQEACAKLYTRTSFPFEVVNRTLRENDRSKLISLGPYIFLVNAYIGSQETQYSLMRSYLPRLNNRKRSSSLTVYRGDFASDKRIDDYRQAVTQTKKYFKWLSFVSTSLDVNVAKSFSRNVLYIIELNCETSKDQFIHLENISCHVDEKEVLLCPGVRFRVNKVESIKLDKNTDSIKVYITILPSYISGLM